MKAHRGRWFVWVGDGSAAYPREKIPHASTMSGSWPGWDVACSCGQWESKTGGATRASVQRDLDDHRIDAQLGSAL
jgi:hypothetical protein